MNYGKRLLAGVLSAALVTLIVGGGVLATCHTAAAAYPTITIVFSNVGGKRTDGSLDAPKLSLTREVTGLSINGHTMVKATDLQSYMAASLSKTTYYWRFTRGGQRTYFYPDDTYFDTSISYTIADKSTTPPTDVNYSQWWYGYTDEPAIVYETQEYVRLTTAANQLGALLVWYNASIGKVEVYDWRVNGSTPVSDSNSYVVGGRWLNGWDSEGDTHLAPHFHLDELWDLSSTTSNPTYARQLKMSVNQLQSLENVRQMISTHAMDMTSGFRSWYHNVRLSNSWDKSFHMRGRAWDSIGDADEGDGPEAYNLVYDEFNNTYEYPIDAGSFWRTRVTDGASQGYEIEKMPQSGDTWLHLQRKPGVDTALDRP